MSDKHIYIQNTLGRQKEVFVPLKQGHVSMYHCGPTVYWNQHIGNMRAVVISDLIRNTFIYAGYDVQFVRNYTDVGHLTGDNLGDADTGEDRMTRAVEREHIDPLRIAEKYIKSYEHDIAELSVSEPNAKPRATENIDEMIAMVETLLKNGNAYTTDLAVYFDTTTYPGYTALSGQDLSEQLQSTGHGTVHDGSKRNPSDFALWFFKAGTHANALQTWKSPFTSPLVADGEGFPGWHIECSAMIKKFLGESIDIHMGGIEHIPIHHTNEIAQSVCANEKPFATYWVHNEHLLVDGKKMSKSEGTSFLLADIVERGFSPLTLRYFFLQAHYRSKQNFTWEALAASDTAYKKLKVAFSKLPDGGEVVAAYKEKFEAVLFDDFNTPAALAVIWEILKDNSVSSADCKATILSFDSVFKLKLDEAVENPKEINASDVPEEIYNLLEEREKARTHKDWVTSDKIRDILLEKGYTVTDISGEQIVSRT